MFGFIETHMRQLTRLWLTRWFHTRLSLGQLSRFYWSAFEKHKRQFWALRDFIVL